MPLLSLLIWLPIVGGALTLFVGSERAGAARMVALLVSVLTFVASVPLYWAFDNDTAAMQFIEQLPWIPTFNAEYFLGVDGISMPLIMLTTFTTPLVVIAGWEVIKVRPAQYMAAFLVMEGLMIGVFSALDGLLFYVFWEAMLVPMFLIIGVWGGERRVYATVKFFLYTFLGSVFMLIALIYMYLQSGSYNILDFHALGLGMREQTLIFFAFLLAFAVKVPMWPVHTWLPDAHVEAPTGGSVILAAIMLKMGGYGFVRFSLPITPDASGALDWLLILLSLIAVVYIGFVALVQQDMKKARRVFVYCPYGFRDPRFFRRVCDRRSTRPRQRRATRHAGGYGADDLPRINIRRVVLCVWVSCMTAYIAARLAPTAGSPIPCRNSLRSWCCSPSPTPVCRVPQVSSANSWSFWGAFTPTSGSRSWLRPH